MLYVASGNAIQYSRSFSANLICVLMTEVVRIMHEIKFNSSIIDLLKLYELPVALTYFVENYNGEYKKETPIGLIFQRLTGVMICLYVSIYCRLPNLRRKAGSQHITKRLGLIRRLKLSLSIYSHLFLRVHQRKQNGSW